MAKTTDQFLNEVKKTVTIPANQVLLQDQDILDFGTKQQSSKMVPLMLSLRQDFFLRVEHEPFISGQDQYPINYRAIGRSLQDVKFFDGKVSRRMSLIQTNDVQYFYFSAEPFGFYLRGDNIIVVPPPEGNNVSSQLEQWFFFRPNDLTSVSNAGKIVTVAGDMVTVDNVPPTITVGSLVDVIQGVQGNATLAYDCPVTNISGNTVTLATGSLTVAVAPAPVPTVISGDWISPAQTTPVIQLPDESFDFFVNCTCLSVLGAVGDFEGKKDIMNSLKEIRTDLEQLLSPRVENSSRKVIQRNGLLNGSRMRYVRGLLR